MPVHTSNYHPDHHTAGIPFPPVPYDEYQQAIGHDPCVPRRIAQRIYGINDPEVWFHSRKRRMLRL